MDVNHVTGQIWECWCESEPCLQRKSQLQVFLLASRKIMREKILNPASRMLNPATSCLYRLGKRNWQHGTCRFLQANGNCSTDQDLGITGGKIHLSPGWCGNLLKFVRNEVVLTGNGMHYGELNVEMESHEEIPLCTAPCLQLRKHRKPLGSQISLSRRDSPY